MGRTLQRSVRRWMDSERHGAEPEAEAALARVFAALPPPSPVPGLADHILSRAGLAHLGERRRALVAAWTLRWGVGACLLLGGLAAVFAPGVVLAVAGAVSPSAPLVAAAEAVAALSSWLAAAATLGGTLLRLGDSLASQMLGPSLFALLAASSLVGAGALRGLHSLLVPHGSTRHAGTV